MAEHEVALFSFWNWFFEGEGDEISPGIHQYFDSFSLLFFPASLLLTWLVEKPLADVSVALMLPVCGMLFGITFAWSANITVLLTTKELTKAAQFTRGGIRGHLYASQSTILIVLITAVCWGLACLGVVVHFIWEFILYYITCICIRECWALILFAHQLTVARKDIAVIDERKDRP